METEMNKWCFIKIFSKNTIAPQLWTSSVLKYSLAGRQTDNQDKETWKKKDSSKLLKTNLWFVCKL